MRLLLVAVCAVVTACGAYTAAYSGSIEATSDSQLTTKFAIANRTPVPLEVVFYRNIHKRAADSTRKKVPPDTRIVFLVDKARLERSVIPEVEIVGFEMPLYDVAAHSEIVIYEGTVAKAEPGFFEIARPTKRHIELVIEAAKRESSSEHAAPTK